MKILTGRKAKEEKVEQLLLENYDRYYRLAFSYVHNADDAGDIVQNGAYKAIRNNGSLKNQEYAATWLYRIMLNEIYDFFRRRRTLSIEALEESGETEPAGMDTYQDFDLRAALDTLSVEDKLVVELRYFEDVKLQEIAEIVVKLPEDREEAVPEVQENMERSVEEINAQMQQISEQLIAEFEEALQSEEGYLDMMVDSEIVSSTEDCFSLKLICYQAVGSGAEWAYFYTVDLNTGKRLSLSDFFAADADFITPVSNNIKEQMRAQMAEDSSKMYWVDSTDMPEWNFEAITEETSFYLNGDGELVICFNEGDVAPMYMGYVEFVIPGEAVENIWSYGD